MPIQQEQPSQPASLPQIIATAAERPDDLEYPHPPAAVRTVKSAMPLILWSFAFSLGILVLVGRMPINAPQFEQLTQYVCDPPPRLPIQAIRLATYPLEFKCRVGDQVLYQRQAVTNGSNPRGLYACRQEGSLIRVWRMPPPSHYGAYVFHSTCGDQVLMDYKHRAAAYESTQRFVIVIAFIIIFVSACFLTARLTRHLRARKIPRSVG